MESYSPKASPRDARSPAVSSQDTSGTLKTTISLGKNPTIVYSGPFYLWKEQPGKSELTGAMNLMNTNGLEHSYTKLSKKKVKEQLSSFLPNIPGDIDGPGQSENGSLRSVIEKPPIVGKEIRPLSSVQLAGFRLHPGPLPEKYRYLHTTFTRKQKKKHKKHKHKDSTMPLDASLMDTHEKKIKKQKRNEDDKERKKRKKEKKQKKQRHTPEYPGGGTGLTGSSATGGSGSGRMPQQLPMFF